MSTAQRHWLDHRLLFPQIHSLDRRLFSLPVKHVVRMCRKDMPCVIRIDCPKLQGRLVAMSVYKALASGTPAQEVNLINC